MAAIFYIYFKYFIISYLLTQKKEKKGKNLFCFDCMILLLIYMCLCLVIKMNCMYTWWVDCSIKKLYCVHSSQINCKTLNSEKKPHTSEKQNCMAAIFYIYFKYFIDKSIGLVIKMNCMYTWWVDCSMSYVNCVLIVPSCCWRGFV
jgi:hypothetical protein